MIRRFPCYCNLCEHELIAYSMLGIHMVHGNVPFKMIRKFPCNQCEQESKAGLMIQDASKKKICQLKHAKGYTLIGASLSKCALILQAILLSKLTVNPKLISIRFGSSLVIVTCVNTNLQLIQCWTVTWSMEMSLSRL